jgi:hypothetical protein
MNSLIAFWAIHLTLLSSAPDTTPLERSKVFAYPVHHTENEGYLEDEPFVFYYASKLEKKVSLQSADSFAVLIRVIGNDQNEYRLGNLITLNSMPELLMKPLANGLYRYVFVPKDKFAGILPSGVSIRQMIIRIYSIPYCFQDRCEVDGAWVYNFPCSP